MKECTQEAFWYRSMPSAFLAGAAAYWAVKAGKVKTSKRFGSWPIVVGFGSFSYLVAKVSYVLGENCINKFLTQVPESEISYHIRKKRGIPHPGELVEGVDYSDYLETAKPLSNFHLADVVDSEDFDETVMSLKEHQILADCNSAAFYQYSLPAMVGAGGSVYAAVTQSSRLQQKSLMKKSFPVMLGCAAGYFLGQVLYMYSEDCTNRFLQYAPEGEIAARLRQQFHGSDYVAGDVCQGCQVTDVLEKNSDEYVVPSAGDASLKDILVGEQGEQRHK